MTATTATRREARRWRLLALAGVLLLLVSACGDDEDEGTAATTTAASDAVSLSIASPADGATVEGNVVALDIEVEGIEIVAADGDTSGATGHLHVFVDRDPVAAGEAIPKEAGIVHTTDDPVSIEGLTPGEHRFVVVVGDGTHTRIGDTEAEVSVTVSGPSVDASAPATVPAGQAATVEIAVEGVEIVAADGDTSGATGHLHLFVDRDPTPAGQAIPKEDGIVHTTETSVDVPDLAPGEHVIHVVLGDGAHMPFDPAVRDTVRFTVQ